MAFLSFGKRKKIPSELPDLISDEIEKESATELNNFLGKEEKRDEKSVMGDGKSVVKDEKRELENKNNGEEKKNTSQGLGIRDQGLEEERYSKNTNNQNSEQGSNQASIAQDLHSTNRNGGVVKSRESIQTEKNVLSRLVKSVEETPNKRESINPMVNKSFFSDVKNNISKDLDDLGSLEDWFDSRFSSRDVLGDMKNYWEHQKKISVLEAAGKNFKERISKKISHLQELEKKWQMSYFEVIEKEEEIREEEAELKELLQEFMKICKDKKEKMLKSSQVGKSDNVKEESKESNDESSIEMQKNKNEEVEYNNDGETKETKEGKSEE